MKKIYESPDAEIVSFEAMEQLALLAPQEDNYTESGKVPGISGSIGDRGDDY